MKVSGKDMDLIIEALTDAANDRLAYGDCYPEGDKAALEAYDLRNKYLKLQKKLKRLMKGKRK